MLAPVLDSLDGFETLIDIQRAQARLAALEASALVAVAGAARDVLEVRVPHIDGRPDRTLHIEDAVAEEVAAAMRIAPRTARTKIDAARQLVGPLAPMHAELLAGRITSGHAAAIAREAGRLPRAIDGEDDDAYAEHCRQLLDRVLPFALTHTPGETARRARGVIARIDPDGTERRRKQATVHEDVTVWDEVDGQSVLSARMSTPDAYVLLAAINALAQDDRFVAPNTCTAAQRRVEALKALVLTHATSESDDEVIASARTTAHIGVVVPLETMLGLSDEPALLTGSGPINASAAREVVANCGVDSTMYRLVVDPDGTLLDLGRQRYEVSDAQRAFVAARDVTCRFPGCAARAIACQMDHAVPWDDGGRTDAQNLGALCARHHQLKTHAGWEILESAPDGSCTWLSPLGRDYQREPAFATA